MFVELNFQGLTSKKRPMKMANSLSQLSTQERRNPSKSLPSPTLTPRPQTHSLLPQPLHLDSPPAYPLRRRWGHPPSAPF